MIPAHTGDLFVHPWWLLIYFWTFAVIASLWFHHQRLFGVYFVPTAVNVVANFVVLSMVGLIVYFVQIYGRLHRDADQGLAFVAYFCCFGIAYLVMGMLYWSGTRARWPHLNERERRMGVRVTARTSVVGVSVLIGVLFSWRSGSLSVDGIMPLFVCFALGIVALRVGLLAAKPRIERAVTQGTFAENR